MKYEEARKEAILGARITADTLGEGWFVDYQFNGMRIVTPNGSHSGYRPTEADLAADWTIDTFEPVVPVFVPPPKPWTPDRGDKPAIVGTWGNPLKTVAIDLPGVTTRDQAEQQAKRRRRIELGEAGKPPADATLYASTKGGGKSWGRKAVPSFELAKQVPLVGTTFEAKINVDKWGQAKLVANEPKPNLDKWGKPQ